ncbi:M50 family metallopeptidase [Caulobacter mirabilis]|uniref:RIP metalloprotease RseP n=1 Tax=Caulobacter mirabilis TaxID=69666 RepID=A0A2D2AXY6_9CAUL|nr:M50 family metallopeptidase [Caulobacter mirabilis]ATQ42841.1 RIP metalloprotease RseP [Caulobacter mirabilis]
MPDLVSWILPFLFVLTLVVTIHELGHFWAARAFGTVVESFSIGFGKPILKWRDKSGVEWRIGWLPLGGYVRFAGDDNAASAVPDQDDLDEMKAKILAHNDPEALRKFYHFKPVWQRAIIAAAGPFANFVLAVLLFAVLAGAFGQTLSKPRISQVTPGSAAEAAGFLAGDTIRRIDGKPIQAFQDIEDYVAVRGGVPMTFVVDRAGREIELNATPRLTERVGRDGGRVKMGLLGIAAQPRSEADLIRVRYGPIEALGYGVSQTWRVLDTTLFYLGRIITGQVPPDQIGGVIGIAKASDTVAKMGAEGAPNFAWGLFGAFVALLSLSAVLSVSIGFLNLLPIPVLDGGHLLFYAYEAVARRPLAASVQAVGYRLGLALLVGFMLFAVWNDLQRYNVFNFLGGLFS